MTIAEPATVDDTHNSRRAWAAVALLAIVGTLNYADVISDALRPDLGTSSLGRALLIVSVFQVLAIVFYLAASRRFMREIIDMSNAGNV